MRHRQGNPQQAMKGPATMSAKTKLAERLNLNAYDTEALADAALKEIERLEKALREASAEIDLL